MTRFTFFIHQFFHVLLSRIFNPFLVYKDMEGDAKYIERI